MEMKILKYQVTLSTKPCLRTDSHLTIFNFLVAIKLSVANLKKSTHFLDDLQVINDIIILISQNEVRCNEYQ